MMSYLVTIKLGKSEVKDYLHEWGVKMHKGAEDISYKEKETNSII